VDIRRATVGPNESRVAKVSVLSSVIGWLARTISFSRPERLTPITENVLGLKLSRDHRPSSALFNRISNCGNLPIFRPSCFRCRFPFTLLWGARRPPNAVTASFRLLGCATRGFICATIRTKSRVPSMVLEVAPRHLRDKSHTTKELCSKISWRS